MHLGLKCMSCDQTYYMRGKKSSITREEQYLRVIITHSLSWSIHVNSLANEANRKLGIITRGVLYITSVASRSDVIYISKSLYLN